jgi:hypothetical protein
MKEEVWPKNLEGMKSKWRRRNKKISRAATGIPSIAPWLDVVLDALTDAGVREGPVANTAQTSLLLLLLQFSFKS